jgi:hypothetical protein
MIQPCKFRDPNIKNPEFGTQMTHPSKFRGPPLNFTHNKVYITNYCAI